jgi:hypothetical protein
VLQYAFHPYFCFFFLFFCFSQMPWMNVLRKCRQDQQLWKVGILSRNLIAMKCL